MLTVISPAKRLDFDSELPALEATTPTLLEDTQALLDVTGQLTPTNLSDLMNISEALGLLNYSRFQALLEPESALKRQAVLAFKGDVYIGLDAGSLSSQDLTWAQSRLAILSGLYGILRPLDLIAPYRLEMGTRLQTPRGKNLYAFWADKVADEVNARLADHPHPVVVNLASNEYFKVLGGRRFKTQVVTPVFKEHHKGALKVISFNAKKARGQMSRWIIDQRLEDPRGLTAFAEDRYVYQPTLSSDTEVVFTRTFEPAGR